MSIINMLLRLEWEYLYVQGGDWKWLSTNNSKIRTQEELITVGRTLTLFVGYQVQQLLVILVLILILILVLVLFIARARADLYKLLRLRAYLLHLFIPL